MVLWGFLKPSESFIRQSFIQLFTGAITAGLQGERELSELQKQQM